MKRSEILVVGRKPLPIGGVTIHVGRLCEWLERKGVAASFLDSRGARLWELCFGVARHRLVHIHSTNAYFMLFMAAFSKAVGTISVSTLHGDLARDSGLRRAAMRIALWFTDVPVMLNQKSHQAVRKFNGKARLISAFIPPIAQEPLDRETVEEIARRSRGKDVVCATNAYDLALNHDGSEVYGITEIIEVLKDKNALLVVSDPSGNYQGFALSMLGREALENVLFISRPHSFYAVLSLVDVFIRNTTTDGDSLSIHEALHLGKQVWASDCVSRPPGVRVYARLAEVLSSSVAPEPYAAPATVDEIISLYQEILCVESQVTRGGAARNS